MLLVPANGKLSGLEETLTCTGLCFVSWLSVLTEYVHLSTLVTITELDWTEYDRTWVGEKEWLWIIFMIFCPRQEWETISWVRHGWDIYLAISTFLERNHLTFASIAILYDTCVFNFRWHQLSRLCCMVYVRTVHCGNKWFPWQSTYTSARASTFLFCFW